MKHILTLNEFLNESIIYPDEEGFMSDYELEQREEKKNFDYELKHVAPYLTYLFLSNFLIKDYNHFLKVIKKLKISEYHFDKDIIRDWLYNEKDIDKKMHRLHIKFPNIRNDAILKFNKILNVKDRHIREIVFKENSISLSDLKNYLQKLNMSDIGYLIRMYYGDHSDRHYGFKGNVVLILFTLNKTSLKNSLDLIKRKFKNDIKNIRENSIYI